MRIALTSVVTAGFLALMLAVSTSGSGPNGPEEFAIRKLLAGGGSVPRTENGISWPAAYPRPSVGREPGAERTIDSPVRFVFADSADLAYEYGTFQLPSGNTEGAYLRVWQKVAGQWRLTAELKRPYAP
jgi:hypothetical protein